jgi:hypothetical protein
MFQDICNCAAFYADKASEKVEKMCETGSSEEKNFKVKREVNKHFELTLRISLNMI